MIKKITLLMCEEYTMSDNKICMSQENCESANVKMKEYNTIECEKFSTYLFVDAIKISLSIERIDRYIQMDKLYIGVSNRMRLLKFV